ncbi:MAG: metallophosphoesterase [Rhodothalassiaceae bacterium]
MQPHPLHLTLPVNDTGTDYYVGDLHGCLEELNQHLARLDFDPKADRLICVGDLVDRGPFSRESLALLDEPWFFAVRGNHEVMLIDTLLYGADRDYWRMNGGDWADQVEDEELLRLAKRADALPVAISVTQPEGDPVGITHAEYTARDWNQLPALLADITAIHAMVWGRKIIKGKIKKTTKNVAYTLHGHTPVDRVTRLGNAVFLDTGAVYGGGLTVAPLADLVAD